MNTFSYFFLLVLLAMKQTIHDFDIGSPTPHGAEIRRFLICYSSSLLLFEVDKLSHSCFVLSTSPFHRVRVSVRRNHSVARSEIDFVDSNAHRLRGVSTATMTLVPASAAFIIRCLQPQRTLLLES